MNEGIKFDTGKPMMSLWPPYAVEAMAQVLTFGAKKYGPRNWMLVGKNAEGFDGKDRYLSAALRHIVAMLKGEYIDNESKLPHAAHAMCCLAFLIDQAQATSSSQQE